MSMVRLPLIALAPFSHVGEKGEYRIPMPRRIPLPAVGEGLGCGEKNGTACYLKGID